MTKNNFTRKANIIYSIIILTLILMFSINFVSAVTIQDYAPNFYLYDYSDDTDILLVQHFESNDSLSNENVVVVNASFDSGFMNNSANLTGASYIDYGNNYDFTTENFTIEFWIKTNDTSSAATWGKHIVGKNEYGEYGAYAVTLNKDSNTGKITFKGSQSGPDQYLWDVTSNTIVNDGEWHHVAVVRDYSDTVTGARIYIDGFSDINGTQTQGSVTNSYDFTVGADNGGDETFFTGMIDELVVTNRSKTVDEIKADVLIYPENGSTYTTSVLNLNWTDAEDLDDDAINYTVQISNDSNFNNLIVNETGIEVSNYTTPTLNSTTYYWRVNPINMLKGLFSNVQEFIINNLEPVITWITPSNDDNYIPIFRIIGFTQNISFTDSFLNQYNCTIYNDSAMTNSVWTVQKTIVGNTAYTENSSIDTASWHGYYYERCNVSDT